MSEIEVLNKEKNKLMNDKINYLRIVKTIEKEIENKEIEISRICKSVNNGHDWITERESGPYGESFTFCKQCKIDYYGRYFHN